MGQLCGSEDKKSIKSNNNSKTASSPKSSGKSLGYSWEQCPAVPKKLDRSTINKNDFWIRDRTDETIIRRPGDICGEQFIIENCTNCDFYVLDNSETITIDKCNNCRFFIGPIASSIFVRTSENVKFGALACQQFRTRDCKNMDVLLYSGTRPIIETTTNIRIGCFNAYYVELANQFSFSKLSVFNNIWNVIHDFTPDQNGSNYSFLPNTTRYTDFMKSISSVCPDVLSEEQEKNLLQDGQILVPLTIPTSEESNYRDQSRAIVFLPGHSGDASQFTRLFYSSEEAKNGQIAISKTKECKFDQTAPRLMFKRSDSSEASKATKLIPQGATIVFKIVGNTNNQLDTILDRLCHNINTSGCYRAKNDQEARELIEYVFVSHRSDIN
jgi:hypothetical protein